MACYLVRDVGTLTKEKEKRKEKRKKNREGKEWLSHPIKVEC